MNGIKGGGGEGVTEDLLNEEGEQWKWGFKREAKDHETRKQFCCLISSSINYKLIQDSTWNSKITKGLLQTLLVFHISRVNMPVCRQTVCPYPGPTVHYSKVFNKALHTSFVKAAATGVFGKDPTQEDQWNRLYKLLHNAERNTWGFFYISKIPCASLKVIYSKPTPSWLLFDFAYTHFPAFYGASLSMGGVPLISGFPNLGIVPSLSSPPSRLLLQLNIGLCQRHNTLLRAWAWAHCWQGFGFGHFNLPENLGGQLVVTWAQSDQRQVLTRYCPWGTISNLTAWCPTLPRLSAL